MYSVVEIGGHQYKVKAGDVLDVQKLEAEEGKDIDLKEVLFVGGKEALVGKPTVAGANVKAKVIKHDRSRKILVFKRKPGLYRTKNGHRQHYTTLLITELDSGNGEKSAIDKASKSAKKYLK